MERVKREVLCPNDWVARILCKQDEIVDWINEHQKPGEVIPVMNPKLAQEKKNG